jgi:hypothetical protein
MSMMTLVSLKDLGMRMMTLGCQPAPFGCPASNIPEPCPLFSAPPRSARYARYAPRGPQRRHGDACHDQGQEKVHGRTHWFASEDYGPTHRQTALVCNPDEPPLGPL